MTKICKKCEEAKFLTEFHKAKGCRDGLRGECKNCVALYGKNWRGINDNTPKAIARRKKYREENKSQWEKWHKKYYEINKEKIVERNRLARIARKKIDSNFKLLCNLRSRLRCALAGKHKKVSTTKNLLGCSVEELRQHLEKQFAKGMCWENYGYGNDKWNVDHIKPCALFDMAKEDEQRACFHYSNLQPLWQNDNFKKGSRLSA